VATHLLRIRDATGLEIRLTRDCWEEHIMVRHPIMRRYFDQVVQAVTSPDVEATTFKILVQASFRLPPATPRRRTAHQ